MTTYDREAAALQEWANAMELWQVEHFLLNPAPYHTPQQRRAIAARAAREIRKLITEQGE